jgi:hypothetical protein
MEQAAALTMSDKTAPPSREATPGPKANQDTKGAEIPAPLTSDSASTSTTDTATPPAAADSSQTLSQRLYAGNFEEEVGQVMKGLGSFWGGFKAKVGGGDSGCLRSTGS